MVQDIFNEYARFPQVRAMAIGGSRAVKRNDEFSDYDVYVTARSRFPRSFGEAYWRNTAAVWRLTTVTGSMRTSVLWRTAQN